MKKRTTGFDKGVSLLEILVVLGLMAAILAVTIPAFFRLLQAYRSQTTANIISTNLRFARNAALKQKVKYRFTFHDNSEANPNTYMIEYDPLRDGSFPILRNMDTDIPDGIKIDPTSLDQVEFDSRGAASTSGYVLLTGLDGTQYKINLTLMGAVSVVKEE